MGTKGQKLYECEECHERRFVAWVEQARAARPKCYGCGSSRLEIVSEAAQQDRARLRQEGSGRTSAGVIEPEEET